VDDPRAGSLGQRIDVDARLGFRVRATQDTGRHRLIVVDTIGRHDDDLEAAHEPARERTKQLQMRASSADEHEAA
jgi:hypothetical protein